MAAATDATVVVERLNHHYGKGALRKQILFDVSTTIPAGEIVIVTGPSGSGKTTLLTLVGALRAPQEGTLSVLGHRLDGARRAALEDVRKKIGFIFQQHNLLGALTASQNVQLGLGETEWPRAERRRKAEAMLDAVGLAEHIHKRAEHLSGGQRQRVAIARALVGEPSMVLADEPTASLDKASGREVVDRMQSLARERGTTILLVTHDNRILDVADRILHLEDGKLTTFTDAVIANTQQMMHLLAKNNDRRNLEQYVDGMDEKTFRSTLQELTAQSQRFLEATALASDEAYQSMLEQSLRIFTRRVGELLQVERASLFLVDHARQQLVLRVDDAYADPRFNRAVDDETGFRTRSVLCLPLHDREGKVFAVTQLLNRRDGRPFDDDDTRRYREFAASLSVLLESLVRIGAVASRHTS